MWTVQGWSCHWGRRGRGRRAAWSRSTAVGCGQTSLSAVAWHNLCQDVQKVKNVTMSAHMEARMSGTSIGQYVSILQFYSISNSWCLNVSMWRCHDIRVFGWWESVGLRKVRISVRQDFQRVIMSVCQNVMMQGSQDVSLYIISEFQSVSLVMMSREHPDLQEGAWAPAGPMKTTIMTSRRQTSIIDTLPPSPPHCLVWWARVLLIN